MTRQMAVQPAATAPAWLMGPVKRVAVNRPCQASKPVVSSSRRARSRPPRVDSSCMTKPSTTGVATPTVGFCDRTDSSRARAVKPSSGGGGGGPGGGASGSGGTGGGGGAGRGGGGRGAAGGAGRGGSVVARARRAAQGEGG